MAGPGDARPTRLGDSMHYHETQTKKYWVSWDKVVDGGLHT